MKNEIAQLCFKAALPAGPRRRAARCRPLWASLPRPGTRAARASPSGPEALLPAQHVQFYEAAICLLVYFSLILSGLGCEIPRLLRGGQAARQPEGSGQGSVMSPHRRCRPGAGAAGGPTVPSPRLLAHRATCPMAGIARAAPWPLPAAGKGRAVVQPAHGCEADAGREMGRGQRLG